MVLFKYEKEIVMFCPVITSLNMTDKKKTENQWKLLRYKEQDE